jgi:hypothetical protein
LNPDFEIHLDNAGSRAVSLSPLRPRSAFLLKLKESAMNLQLAVLPSPPLIFLQDWIAGVEEESDDEK